MPIYDLGSTLIAVQRMVYKAHLTQQGQLERGTRLGTADRDVLALQIASHESGSDRYGLAPFRPAHLPDLDINPVIASALSAMTPYVHKDVQFSLDERVSLNSLLSFALYTDVLVLTDRIDIVRGIERLEITAEKFVTVDHVPLIIDDDVRDYVKSLKGQTITGKEQELSGELSRLDFERGYADVRVSSRQKVKVKVTEDIIERLRYEASRTARVTFLGKPIHRFGKDIAYFDRFDAAEVLKISDLREPD
jgi:hypothetical protein